MTNKKSFEKEIKHALENNEFVLYYQPQIEVSNGKMGSMEALIRWNHPEGRIVPPAEFIPMAERTRLILPIGHWVLEAACRQIKEWKDKGYLNISVAVNISALQLEQEDLFENLKRVLYKNQVRPELLELEITEGIPIRFLKTAADLICRIRNLGIKIALDDFGTGYSSLGYLKSFPVDILKIDKSFIKEIAGDFQNNVVDGIIAMAHKMKLQVVAEGVETRKQLDYLREGGCDKVQGYIFSKPANAEEMEQFLRKTNLSYGVE